MNHDLINISKEEIKTLLDKNLIRHSKSHWTCAAFYVNNQVEKEREVPILVINYKLLNGVLEWIRYLIPNKRYIINRLHKAEVFSNFDLKFGFWKIQVQEQDKYKITFTISFGHL